MFPMFRSVVRVGTLALCVVLFLSSAPARALPLAGETEGFSWSLSALWERLIDPVVALWTDGGTTPGGGSTSGGGATINGVGPCEGGGTCDPNG